MHIITTMNTGGAERMLSNLLNESDNCDQTLVILMEGEIKYSLPNNIKIYQLKFNKKKLVITETIKLFRLINNIEPEILQTWLTHPNTLGLLYKKFINKNIKLIWNIRHGFIKQKSIMNRYIFRYQQRNINRVNGIIYVSKDSKKEHESHQFYNKNSQVIPNGFIRERNSTTHYRSTFNINQSTFVLGHVGRYDEIKNQKIIMEAFNELCNKGFDLVLLMIGRGMLETNYELMKYVDDHNKSRLLMLGEQRELDSYYKIMDLFILTSFSEGYPNVIGESMANGTPVLTTNAGDSFDIIKDVGFKMKTYEAAELIWKLERIIKEPDSLMNLGRKSKERIIKEFSVEKIVDQYHEFYKYIATIP